MAIQPDILASTLRILKDREVDNTFRNIPLLDAIRSHGAVIESDGGSKVNCPAIMTEHSMITQLSSGYESVNLAVKDPLRQTEYNWCDFVAPVVITEKEQLSNKGDRAVINIAEARLKSVMGMLQREFCKQVVNNESTVLSELQTLSPFSSTGWFGCQKFGSQSGLVGGLDKAVYTDTFQNQYVDCPSAFPDVGDQAVRLFRAMSKLYIDTQVFAPEGEVDIILMSPRAYELYKNSLFAQERYTSIQEERDMAGKLGLMFNGAKVYVEPNLGSKFTDSGSGASYAELAVAAKDMDGDDIEFGSGSNQYSTDGSATENFFGTIDAMFLNSKLLSLYFDRDAFFEMGEFERISGYAAMAANIMTRTQLTTSNLSGHGILINAFATKN
tara:strand:+ start:6627 stop:7781 length:1155 start_codon:yes stop_codon:yes gene_type:complete